MNKMKHCFHDLEVSYHHTNADQLAPYTDHIISLLHYDLAYGLQALTLKVLVATIDAQWEGMGDVGSARYEPALHPPCPTIRVLSYSN